MNDDELLSLLRVIGGADEAAEPIDSQSVSLRLGWAAERTAKMLAEARSALLVWGVRVAGQPAPCFDDLELTVQGRRLLRAADTSHGPVVGGD